MVARVADAKPILEGKPAEEPLTPEEIAEMRHHLRFLREHRRVLHLRVNAHEDLLLNEVREPTRRGVCQHLLSKVDRAQVFSAAERLDPAAATRLAEGILRISPNVDYLLLYLDCVRRSAPENRAVSALAQALEQIDFLALTQGQMRRVLDLIVELFDHRQLPQMLLGLLEGRAFREAFDTFAPELPSALAEIVVPLRAAQAVVLHGQPNRFGPAMLERGVRLLLQGDENTLLRYPIGVRRRLIALGVTSSAPGEARPAATLRSLLESLKPPAPQDLELSIELARQWIRLGRDSDARQLLKTLERTHSNRALPRRWLESLDAPRLGRLALIDRKRSDAKRAEHPSPAARRSLAIHLDTLQPATLITYGDDQRGDATALIDLVASLTVPGIAHVLDFGSDDQGRPYFAIARPGQLLSFLLERRGAVDRRTVVSACAEAATILATLARLGVRMPDVQLRRFELDPSHRLWLTDLSGVTRGAVETIEAEHARLIARFCHDVFNAPASHIPPAELLSEIERTVTATEAAQLLGRLRPSAASD